MSVPRSFTFWNSSELNIVEAELLASRQNESDRLMVEEAVNATLGLLLRRYPLFHPVERLAPAHWLEQGLAPRGLAAALGGVALASVVVATLAQTLWIYMFLRSARSNYVVKIKLPTASAFRPKAFL